MEEIQLPIMINGRKIYEGEQYEFEYATGVKVKMPKLTSEMVDEIRRQDKNAVHDLPIKDVIEFYGKVGDLWKNKNYPLRRECVKYASMVTGYSEEVIEFDMENIADMARRPYLGDVLDLELGNRMFLDQWEHKRNSLVHAEPRGKLLHIMVGNVPIASIYSIIRGGITKNVNLMKLPRRDVVTALYFCLSFLDVDPNHPITKSTSIMIWEGGQDNVEDEIIGFSDMVCVWGGGTAVEGIKKKVPAGVPLIEYGPRRSFQIIGETTIEEKKEVVRNSVIDICMYDQEACFSTQIIYVKNDAREFAQILAVALQEASTRIPKGFTSRDYQANIQLERSKAEFQGYEVLYPADTEWTIIVTPEVISVDSHPLSRTVYVMPINDYDEILPYVDSDVQTVAMFPYSLHEQLRDKLTIRGVDRIVEVGRTWKPRVGTPHDGTYTLPMMVRWVGLDREMTYNCVSYDKIVRIE